MITYITPKLSKQETEEFLKNCSSINKKGLISPKALLGANGKPIPLDEFMRVTGQRVLRKKFDFSKTPEEREQVKKAKRIYKNTLKLV